MQYDEDWPPSAETLMENPELIDEVREFYPDHFESLLEENPELGGC